ncbi:uncharacterized protein A4U43_C01F21330 [Asparagus officinalis]|uniref:Cell wall hydroxyproline-rich glycoprotein n=2 Tax=Asparagus officinalis TaxID=4686 RepID=A0A5P1FSV1_ASPOF|nr:uncharacterized protein A4U43_C01F21330 [Asparagus officinalis]
MTMMVVMAMASSSPFIGIGGSIGVFINNPNDSPPPSPSQDLNSDYYALQAFKSAIAEDPNGLLTSWAGPNICSYRGIFCSIPQESLSDSQSQAVLAIDLNHANLKGTLVKELSLLSHLSILHLNSNRFSGTIPDSLQNLHFLSELDLSNNHFSGPFPAPALLIPNLIYLDLRFNSFSGEIPDELFEKDLDAIFLNDNQFEGQIPMSLWGSSASVITLANNKLSGSIPASFGYIRSNLKQILFLNNKLTGCIPEAIGYLNDVEVLDLSFNSLYGKLPGTVSCLSGIEVLNIGHNQLSGELSDIVCDLRSLANLTVAYNFFSGFSQDCAKLFFRNVGFDFSGNCIPGRDMQRPEPECSQVPGEGLSCLRTPVPKIVACAVAGIEGGRGYPFPSSLPSSIP